MVEGEGASCADHYIAIASVGHLSADDMAEPISRILVTAVTKKTPNADL